MKIKSSLLLLIIVLGVNGLQAQSTIWTFGTARNVPKNQAEFGILHPMQIGLTETLEVSFSPPLALSLAPNISFKNRWYTGEYLMIATSHTYAMPTLLVRFAGEDLLFKKDPDFNQIAQLDTIPYLFYFRNRGLFTWKTGSESLLTASAGVAFAFQTAGDSLPFFRHPLTYPWATTLNGKFNWNIGVQFDGNIFKNHNYSASLDFNSIGAGIDYFALTHKGYYIYNHSIKFAAMAGYRMMYAPYPDDATSKKFSIFPVIDLIWKINAKKEPVKDLFRR